MHNVKIGTKNVGDTFPCFTVAEIGGMFKNFEEAKILIDDAIEIGIDAVKFQTLEAETITTKNNFFDLNVTGNISQYEFFKKFEPSKELQKKIVKYANEMNITIFSAPSHIHDLELMQEMDLEVYKIGSDLACHIPLIKKVASLGKPIILSTGMCTLDEVRISVDAIRKSGNEDIILLHCVSDYPSKFEELNLNVIKNMKNEFDIPVGFSDHTPGILGSLESVILGGNIIERHFRNPKNSPAPDDIHSLTKLEFQRLIDKISITEKAKGSGKKLPSFSEQKNLKKNRVSIIAIEDIKKGTKITPQMIDVRRPGTGIQPLYYDDILSKTAKCDICKETPLDWSFLE